LFPVALAGSLLVVELIQNILRYLQGITVAVDDDPAREARSVVCCCACGFAARVSCCCAGESGNGCGTGCGFCNCDQAMSSGPKRSDEDGGSGFCRFCAHRNEGIKSKPKLAKKRAARFINKTPKTKWPAQADAPFNLPPAIIGPSCFNSVFTAL
jgi:hypothetical protein